MPEAPAALVPVAAPPAPAPVASPATRTPSSSTAPKPARADFFKKLDARAQQDFEGSSDGKRAAKAADKPAADAAVKPAEAAPAEKPPVEVKSAESKPAEAAPAKDGDFPDEDAAGKMRAGELSRHYKALRKEHAALKAKQAQLEAERSKAPEEHPEFKKLTETLAERDKRLSELNDIVRFKAFEESPEYKDKYEKPFLSAFQSARNKVASLKVIQRTDDLGQVVQEVRKGTADDFDRLFRTQDESDAGELAENLFGPNSASVMYHRERVLEANAAQVQALETFKKEGAAQEQARAEQLGAQMKQIGKQASETWKKSVNAVFEDPKLAPLFQPIEGDVEANSLLEKGFESSREAFKTLNAMDPRLTSEQRAKVVEAHAEMFNKAAGFDRMVYLLDKERKALKAAQQKLKEFEESAPTPGGGVERSATPAATNGSTSRNRIFQELQKRSTPIR